MTVAELMAVLAEMPGDAPVFVEKENEDLIDAQATQYGLTEPDYDQFVVIHAA